MTHEYKKSEKYWHSWVVRNIVSVFSPAVNLPLGRTASLKRPSCKPNDQRKATRSSSSGNCFRVFLFHFVGDESAVVGLLDRTVYIAWVPRRAQSANAVRAAAAELVAMHRWTHCKSSSPRRHTVAPLMSNQIKSFICLNKNKNKTSRTQRLRQHW